VVGAACGENKIGAVSTKPKLSQRPGKIGPAFDQGIETGHVSAQWSSGVVTQDAEDLPDVSASPVLPAVNESHFHPGVLEYCW